MPVDYLGILIVGAAVAAAFGYTLLPFLRSSEAEGDASGAGREDGTAEREVAELLIEREKAYANVRDIEFDREMGKLEEQDYRRMRRTAHAQALAVLSRLESLGVGEGAVAVGLSGREAEEAAARLKEIPPARPPTPPVPPTAPPARPAEATLDERLEEEILRYRKVRSPASNVREEKAKEGSPSARAEKRPDFCPSCGAKVEPAHNFCAACGRALR